MSVIQGIYIALFGRPADPGGLAYWNEVTKNGQDLAEMLRVLPSLNEYTVRFDGQTPDQVITTIYQGLFGRDPDAAGLAFFKGQLDSGAVNMASLAVNIAQGAQGDDKADVQAKVDAAILFTASLDTPEEIEAYKGDAANALARKFLDTVDKDKPATPETVERAAGAVVAGQDPTGGQAPNPGPGGPGGEVPVEGTTERVGKISATAENGKLYVGSGNSADNFNITTTDSSTIEIALKGYKRGAGDTAVPVDGVYSFANDRAGFAYSVASLGDKSLAELMGEGYSFHLTIDTHSGQGFAANPSLLTHFTLEAAVDKGDKVKVTDSGYNWVGGLNGSSLSIIDDEGNAEHQADGTVTQNIQSPIWYGALGSDGILVHGEYSVSIEVKKNNATVAREEITLDVDSSLYSVKSSDILAAVAVGDDGYMLNGTGNSADKFRIIQLDTDDDGEVDMELALGGQVHKGSTFAPTPNGLISAARGDADGAGAPMFKFSVASLVDGKSLEEFLTSYDIKLLVDTDPTSKKNFVELNAEADPNGKGLDWNFDSRWIDDKSDLTPKLTDDAGDEHVSQNIQALGWYQPVGGDTLFTDYASDPGTYTVSLAIYKGENLVGINTLDFLVS